ncbi:MAG: TIGR01777 family protein [Desulfobacteraceae bacterium IS3]|nr:MAG: TIGR01777 family protein [Desulfobacteraceae bacterium IS3]
MKIFITGGTGFVGRNLSNLLLNRGHQVIVTGTRPNQRQISHENFTYISADTTRKGEWQASLKDADAVVNLAGRTIFNLWTRKYKQVIYDSRILTTRNLVQALPQDKQVILCSTSAAGYYGNRGEDILRESETNGDDFLAQVCRDWEAAAFQAEEKGHRVVTMRFGVVLGKNGGAMKQMIPAFRCFVGGPLGNGMQWFPWIHAEDIVSAILFVTENSNVKGALNFVSPNPVRNFEFAATLGMSLKRPSMMPAPAFMIRLMLGEFGTSILYSQRAIPEKLSGYGFTFAYPDIGKAVRNIVSAS